MSRGPQRVEASGIPALRTKFEEWDAIVTSQKWTARNTFVKGNRICIEWQCQLTLRDGRELDFEEVAIHEVRGGKIVAERYYYDPSVLASPRKEKAAPAPKPDEEPTRVLPVASPEEAPSLAAELIEEPPAPIPEENVPQGTPPLDPWISSPHFSPGGLRGRNAHLRGTPTPAASLTASIRGTARSRARRAPSRRTSST